MIWRQKLMMLGTKGMIFAEFFSPIMFAFVFYGIGGALACDDGGTSARQQCVASRSFFMPYIMMFTVPNASSVNARFIIQSLVEDKEKKVRETLRLMSLSRLSYGLSIFVY